MKFRWDNRYLHWGVTAFLVIAASMLFYYGIFHMKTLITGIKTFLNIMAPIIYGFAIAYVLSPVVNFMENTVIYPLLKKKNIQLEKRGRRAVRWSCVLLSLILLLVIIYALIMMVLPQLIRSIVNIIYSFPSYVSVVEKWLNSFVEKGWDMDTEMIDMLNTYSAQAQEYLTNNILPQMQAFLKSFSAGVFDILTFLKNFLIGAIVSIYVLADKELFVARSKMFVYAAFPAKIANTIIHAMRFTNKTFGGFISGKILDSAIIGVLCYIGVMILDMPYAILVSVIVGVTNVIPFFGPYLGAIPCFLLILLVDPMKGLYFLIFILILQQFDGNILGPKILGDSTGLSSFMVIVAIMVGGGLFGIPGMIVGVPVFAVLYAIVCKLLSNILAYKKMPVETETYCNIDCLDPQTMEVIPMPKEPTHKEHHHSPNPDSLFMKIVRILEYFLKKFWAVFSSGVKKYWKLFCKKSVVYWKAAREKAKELQHKFREKTKK
ncbi:MAG: AI-2E family transporter [Eubacteriales bacterium]|nr:AI-2E family transporter [Eubacteriales bacterium]